jgi:lantibiotic modifying enzyme
MPWRPLLEGALKDRARDTVRTIVDDLLRSNGQRGGDATLAGGLAGQAILHAYLAPIEDRSKNAKLARDALHHAIDSMAEKPMEATLYSGLAGVGWSLAHLQSRLPELESDGDLAEIDNALSSHLEPSPWRDDYDLINGLVGFGVYALERLPQPAAVTCLERVIDRLAETAQYRADGVAWWTDPKWLPAESAKKCPEGYYNLGLAHGLPGVIALLGMTCAAGISPVRGRSLLDGAVRRQFAHQLPGGFPAWLDPKREEKPARLAWCYGDPGVGIALLGAARSVGEPSWERAALTIARRAVERPTEQAGVVDAGLCHGAAGLGHIFNRMYQATGETYLAKAARWWFARTLEMQRPGHGIGGYQAWRLGDGGELNWETDPGLLTGSVGIALALLAATTDIEPMWDRMLLTAVTPTATT